MKDFFWFRFVSFYFFIFGVQQKDVTGPWERTALETHAASCDGKGAGRVRGRVADCAAPTRTNERWLTVERV